MNDKQSYECFWKTQVSALLCLIRGKYQSIKANLCLLFECYVKFGFLTYTQDICKNILAGRRSDLDVVACPSTVLFSCIYKLLK